MTVRTEWLVSGGRSCADMTDSDKAKDGGSLIN